MTIWPVLSSKEVSSSNCHMRYKSHSDAIQLAILVTAVVQVVSQHPIHLPWALWIQLMLMAEESDEKVYMPRLLILDYYSCWILELDMHYLAWSKKISIHHLGVSGICHGWMLHLGHTYHMNLASFLH